MKRKGERTEKVETIVAPATPPGRGGVAIVRISGPLTKHIIQQVLKKNLSPRHATFASFFDTAGEVIDQGIAIYFPAPHSFTGEDILELQGHGGPVIVDCLIQRILELGPRMARPGEFSERAFLNDRIDLVRAEAIADLIDAASRQAARNAMRSLQGEFSNKIQNLVSELIHLRLYVEAAIDFVEEEIDFLNNDELFGSLEKIIEDLEIIEVSAAQGSLLRDGITLVIAGQPNVGKSSLLNQLSGKDIAIVTDIPGTTRDVLREQILMDGLPLHVIDTAGLRESGDRVEQEGIRRAREEIGTADIILFVTDVTQHDPVFLKDFLQKMPERATLITIKNKMDLINEKPDAIFENGTVTISLSAKSGDGIELLKNAIKKSVGYNMELQGTFSARRRHLDALTRAKHFLLNGKIQLTEHRAGELLAEDLREAQKALNEITGEFTSDDLLGRIFGSFCIGK